MKFSEIELPSNRKFGFFFTVLFALVAIYFYYIGSLTWVYIFAAAASIFLIVTLVKADALLPLNKLWMRFGLLLGMIISPIVLGILFFALFTPIAIPMRLSGRDELRLKFKSKASHWISRSEPIKADSFKNQF
ncbi:MAG: SxtJ family membrane protein [Granulosicoccus sp.]